MAYLRRSVTIPVNDGDISISSVTSTEILPASTKTERSGIIRNTGSVVVHLGFGEDATVAMFGLEPDEVLKTNYLGAIEGLAASGTGTVGALAEER